jgi:RNA 2',3'-cyclic 3'-phosphodiesterase
MNARLFFALWPDDELRAALAGRVPTLLDGVRGKPQRPDQWHVTLEFLGTVPVDRQPAVWAAADGLEGEPFVVSFDRVDHWRRAQVCCLAAAQIPTALARLVMELRAALWANGFVPESRDYQPHVTLSRRTRASPAGPLPEPIIWAADRFALVRSISEPTGSRYEPLRWWNLHHRGG